MAYTNLPENLPQNQLHLGPLGGGIDRQQTLTNEGLSVRADLSGTALRGRGGMVDAADLKSVDS